MKLRYSLFWVLILLLNVALTHNDSIWSNAHDPAISSNHLSNSSSNIPLSVHIQDDVSLLDSFTVILRINGIDIRNTDTIYGFCRTEHISLSVDTSLLSDTATFEWFIDDNTLGAGTDTLFLTDSIMVEINEEFALDSVFNVKVVVNDSSQSCENEVNLVFHTVPTLSIIDQNDTIISSSLVICNNSLPDTLLIESNGQVEMLTNITGISLSENNSVIISDSVPDSQSLLVFQASNGGCGVRDSLQLTISTLNVELGIDTLYVCADSIELDTSLIPYQNMGQGVWRQVSDAGNLTFTQGDSLLHTAIQITDSAYGFYSIVWEERLDSCSSSDTLVLSFSSFPVAFAGTDTTICMGDSIQIGTTTEENFIYYWEPTSGINDTTISNPIVSPSSTTTYTLIVSDERAICQSSDEIEVGVNPTNLGIELIELSYDQQEQMLICGVQPDTLTGSGTLQLNFLPEDEQASVGWILEAIEGNIVIPEDQRTGIHSVTQTIVLDPLTPLIKLSYRAWAGIEGCPPQDSSCVVELVIVSEAGDINIPGVITPNGDGYNDQWVFENASLRATYEVRVFNRQGAIVYESQNYQNDWDGGSLPEGVYWYMVEARQGTPATYEGALLIQRNPR